MVTGMKPTALRVLVLEGHLTDTTAIERELNRLDLPVDAKLIHDVGELEGALTSFAPDVIVADHPLIQTDLAAVVERSRSLRPAAPVIVLADPKDAPAAVNMVRAGVVAVVFTNDLGRLRPAIDTAVSERARLKTLSPRQIEVLRLVAKGLTTRAIAEQLGLSEKTVETHRTELMKRLDIHDLARLVRFAVRMDLVDDGS